MLSLRADLVIVFAGILVVAISVVDIWGARGNIIPAGWRGINQLGARDGASWFGGGIGQQKVLHLTDEAGHVVRRLFLSKDAELSAGGERHVLAKRRLMWVFGENYLSSHIPPPAMTRWRRLQRRMLRAGRTGNDICSAGGAPDKAIAEKLSVDRPADLYLTVGERVHDVLLR